MTSDSPAPKMEKKTISYERYFQIVHGIWIGKFAGGTLGAPIEGLKTIHNFDAAKNIPDSLAENDDTDLQLLWLHALQEHGPELEVRHLVAEWREHVRAPWSEYGLAVANWERGVEPPESGWRNNWFWGDGMGCPIRAEIWGIVAPGRPDIAARLAEWDASLDHTDNSVEAEKFFATIIAAVFFEKDLDRLLDIGLSYVRQDSRLYHLVRDVRAWAPTMDWQAARLRVLQEYGHPDMTHVLQNVGFTLIGLLYGKGDFGETVITALNCGYDSDCTAATAGAILGGILGYEGIPARWSEKIPDEYVVSDWMLGFPRHGSIRELTTMCCQQGVLAADRLNTGVEIDDVPSQGNLMLSVAAQEIPVIVPVKIPYPVWRIVGPFWRNWDERKQADLAMKEHGPTSTLPSAQYFSHTQSGFDTDFLDPASLSFDAREAFSAAQTWIRQAEDDRLPLSHLAGGSGPVCYYAAAEFILTEARLLWLTMGSTGPIQVWLNDEKLLTSETYQPLTPNTCVVAISAKPGVNRLVLKLAKTSQQLEACVGLKHHGGKHWHQCFYDTTIEWRPWQIEA